MKPFSLSKLFLSMLVLAVLAGCSGPAAEVTQVEVEVSPAAPATVEGAACFPGQLHPLSRR